MSADVLSIEKHLYAMVDRHGDHVCYLHIDDARDLLKRGLAKTFGSKKRIHGIQLLAELVEGDATEEGKALTPANYAGCRFVFKQHIDAGNGYLIVYRLKHLEVTESPEHALLRILTPPALESATYTRRDQATSDERAADPGQARRKRQRSVFRISQSLQFTGAVGAVLPAPTTAAYVPTVPQFPRPCAA